VERVIEIMKIRMILIFLIGIISIGCNQRRGDEEASHQQNSDKITSPTETESISLNKVISKYTKDYYSPAIEEGSIDEYYYYVLVNNDIKKKCTLLITDSAHNPVGEYEVWLGRYYISESYGVVIIDDSNQPFSDYIRWNVIDLRTNELIITAEDMKRYVFIEGETEPYYFRNISLMSMELKRDDRDGPYLSILYGQAGYILGEYLYWFDYQADTYHSYNNYEHVDYSHSSSIEYRIESTNLKLMVSETDTVEIELHGEAENRHVLDVFYQNKENPLAILFKEQDPSLTDSYFVQVYFDLEGEVHTIELESLYLYIEDISNVYIAGLSNDYLLLIIETETFHYDVEYQFQGGNSEFYLRLSDYSFESRK
jgi:hypothetical protein